MALEIREITIDAKFQTVENRSDSKSISDSGVTGVIEG